MVYYMNTDILSLLLGAGVKEANQQLLIKIFDINPLGLHLLVPVRNQDDIVIAFRFIDLNHGRSFLVNSDESSLLTDDPSTNTAFRLLLDVYQTSRPVDTVHELTMNGETRWFDVRFRKFADGVLFLYEEITRYKNDVPGLHPLSVSQEEMKKYRAMLDKAEQLASLGSFEYDMESGYLYWSDELYRIHGLEPQTPISKETAIGLCHPDDRPLMKQLIKKAQVEGKTTSGIVRIVRPDGSIRFVRRHAMPVLDEQGKVKKVFGFIQDITMQRADEERLKQTENLLQSVLDTVTVNVYVLKAVYDEEQSIVDFIYLFVNKEAVQAEMTNPLGRSVLDLHPFVKTGGLFKQYCEVMATGNPQDFEMRFDKREGTSWYRITARKMNDKLVVTAENITARKKVEEELQQSIEGQTEAYRNMAAVNDELETARRELAILHEELKAFNSVAANDYKETLRRLYTSMEYIVTHDAQRMSHEGRANVRRAQGAIQRMKLLTEDILAYSGINALETEKTRVDLYALTIEVKKELLKKMDEEQIEVDCKNMPEIEGYPVLISLLFHHLLDHAIKSKKKESSLTIHISCEERYGRDIDHPKANPSMKYSVVELRDNGAGFEPQQAESLFNIFDRSYESRKGSGIGLAIARKIMDMHGGFIYAVGDPGNGASYYCCFPSIS
jgi:PAS domain S-box-containing protein